MRTMTKLFALGGFAAAGAGAFAAVRARRAAKRQQQVDEAFDFSDLDEPVVVTEEVFVITEATPYDIEDDFEMPGRGAGPR
jgi:hypothetical protein